MPQTANIPEAALPPSQTVEAKLRRAWRKECRFIHLRGWCNLALWITALAGVDFLVDWLFLLPGYARLILAVANLAILGWVAYDKWLRHWRRYDPVRVALQVERRHPELKSLLISYVQISDQPRAGEVISPMLIQALRREAIRCTDPMDFREIVNYRELRRVLGFAAAVVLLCAAASINWSAYVDVFLNRMTRPASGLAYPTRTRIVKITGNQVVRQGAPVTIEAVCANRIPAQGRLMVKPAQGPWEQLPLRKTGADRFEYQFAELFQGFAYQVRLGDAVSETFQLQVVPAPRLIRNRVRIEYPAYTGLAAKELDSLNLEVPEGSTLNWKLQCDQRLAAAALIVEGGARVPLQLDASGRECSLSLPATNSFVYRFQWTEREHGYVYDGGVNFFVNTIPDAAPEVELTQPTENEKATVRKKLALAFRANDDYQVANAWVVYSLNQSPEVKLPLGAFTKATVETNVVWDLKQAMPALKEKDVVSFAIEVADNRAGKSGPNLTRTRTLQLAIVSADEYLSYILEKQAKLVKEIESMQKEEQTASREVKGLQETPIEPPPAANSTNSTPGTPGRNEGNK